MNSPASNVVSGPTEAIERFSTELHARGIGNRKLATSHAFHSRMLDPAMVKFRRELDSLEFNKPTGCTISNVTGLPLTETQACDPGYWVDQCRKPVKYSEGLKNFLTEEDPIFVEVGPGKVLTGLVSRHDASRDTVSTMVHPREDASAISDQLALDALGTIWSLGADFDWSGQYSANGVRKIPLPTYPFQQNYYWQDRSKRPEEVEHHYPLKLYEPGWTASPVDAENQVGHGGDWLVFSDDQGIADQVVSGLKAIARKVTVVKVADGYRRISNDRYEMVPGSRQDIQRVLSDLALDGQTPLRVLHFWNMSGEEPPDTELEVFAESCEKGFHTLIALVQAAHDCHMAGRLTVQIYADGLGQVETSTDTLYPEKGSLLGPCLVAPQEIPGLSMRCIDVPGGRHEPSEGSLIGDIVLESAVDSGHALTALRAGKRYAEELFELPEIARGLPRLRYGATVLITGGAGGLGLKLAEHLYDTWNVRLVLTSRWKAPPRKEWAAHAGENTKMGRALGLLSDLSDRQAEILIVQADVRERSDMEHVISEANRVFGPIHGVVHTAGILDDGPVLQKTREGTGKVLAAKVASAYILEEMFENQPLDMFVHFSSQASLRPGKGQVDYSAANAVLDRLSRRRAQNHPGLACAVGWGAWREAGMAWEYKGSGMGPSSLFEEKIGIPLEEPVYETSHPLLKSYRRYRDGDLLFAGSLTRGEHWFTTEHLMSPGDRGFVSATMIYDFVHAGFSEIVPDARAIEFAKMVLYEPFVIDDTTEYEVLFAPDGDNCRVELRTRRVGTNEGWVTNLQTDVRDIPGEPELEPEVLERLLSMRDRKPEPAKRMVHGERWHCDWIGEIDEAGMAAHVRLQDAFHEEVQDFVLHPAIFDRSMHNIMDHYVGELLPYTCESLRVYGRMPAETLAYGRPSDSDADDSTDIVITDLSGNIVVRIDGYVLRELVSMRRGEWADSTPRDGSPRDKAMVLKKEGNLESFESREVFRVPLKPDEVRIDVKAAGLNFRDVLSALGQLPETDEARSRIGSESSGIVSEVGENVAHIRPGDRVVAVAGNCFGTSAMADSHSVSYLPESLTFAEGAGIPITFLTVDYALNQLARLKAGERILIHAATGGIGLAALQTAQHIGAEIFATAGSDSKRQYLKRLGVEHVMDSRSLDFVDEIKRDTRGEGVDVVLNALAGEFIPASLGVLKPFGRFLEIGKRDIYADSKLGLYPFRNNLSYFGVDLGQFCEQRREDMRRMFDSLMQRFATGVLRPSPVTTFPMKEVGKGFELMARAQHIGKIVFANTHESDQKDAALDRFRAHFGRGIGVAEGCEVFTRLISSDETPPCVMAAAESLADSDAGERYLAEATMTRPSDTPYRAPRDAGEEILKQIWEKELGVAPIGIDDDFVNLGGDSINAILIQTSIEETFMVKLSLAVLFRYSTIAEVSMLIKAQSRSVEVKQDNTTEGRQPSASQR